MAESLPQLTSSSQLWLLPPKQPALGALEAHVWRASLEQPAVVVENLRRLLSLDEQARADRFHFEKDRRHFVVARAGLRKLLGAYLGVKPADLRFAYGAHGKPHLTAAMVDHAVELKFNLAHAGGLALFAFTTIGEIGVDLEQVNSDFAGDAIARRFFSAAEVACLDRLPPDDRVLAFFNCWTRKEAFIKAKGLGLSLPLDQFDVSLAPAQMATILATKWDECEAGRWSLKALEVGAGFVGAVALEAHDWQLTCLDFVA